MGLAASVLGVVVALAAELRQGGAVAGASGKEELWVGGAGAAGLW